MQLVQILMPLFDNDGREFPSQVFDAVALELTDRFGGMTAYSRSPAEGRWTGQGETKDDDVVVLEVMVEDLDRVWWREFRGRLERTLRQEQLVVRAQPIELL